MGVGSHMAEVIGPWVSNQWPDFLTQSFIENKAIIQVIRALDWLFSIFGSEIHGSKTQILIKNQVWQKVTLVILTEGHHPPVSRGELFKHSADAESLEISIWKEKLGSFGCLLFVGDIIMRVIRAYLDKIIRPWTLTTRANFLTHFYWKPCYSRDFRAGVPNLRYVYLVVREGLPGGLRANSIFTQKPVFTAF